jgi:two-component system NarL family sensor kinase
LLQAQDEERRKIGRDLHDSVGQYLAVIKIHLDGMNGLGRVDLKQPELISECLHAVNECLKETRTMSYLLHPPLLDEAGFDSAARWYVDGFAERVGIQATLNFPDKMDRLPRIVEVALFRILQESLTNVHRHSGSPTVEVEMEVNPETVILTIRDAGRGIPEHIMKQFSESGTAGIGLAGMRERLSDLGGELRVQSNSKGTVLLATIPLPRGNAMVVQKGLVA